jgi:dUTP pyrophosphatase
MVHLKIKVLDPENRKFYENHSTYHDGDSGLDIFFVNDQIVSKTNDGSAVKLPLGIQIEPSSSFWLIPRSSIVKTPLRMANSVGLIDKGYRGELLACVDNILISHEDIWAGNVSYPVIKGERLFQIVGPMLEPVTFELVDELSVTSRGEGGIGSTTAFAKA